MLHCDIYRNGNLPEYFENSFCDVIACFVADVLLISYWYKCILSIYFFYLRILKEKFTSQMNFLNDL